MSNLSLLRAVFLLLAGLSSFSPGRAGDDVPTPGLVTITFHGQGYLTHTVDPQKSDLRLYYNDDHSQGLRSFATLEKYVADHGEHLLFAANAGMFQPDFKPVGLLMQNGAEQSPINLNEGAGNFFMKPNGVFVINDKHEALIVESGSYAGLLSPVVWATQSGPLLVHGGEIHPEFNPDSTSKKERSGVGVRKDGIVVFALSQGPVTFYEFASLFQTKLKCPNALFLDGDLSAFYVPGQKAADVHFYGPMFGLVEKAK